MYQVLFHCLTHHSEFVKTGAVRYALIGYRAVLKEFAYYSDDAIFGHSIRAKQLSVNALNLRRQCHQFYS